MEIPVQRSPLIQTFLTRNARINLSAIREPEAVYLKHILDALEFDKVLRLPQGTRFLDLGTGGGFPLLPLAIQHPERNFVGLDARKKKLTAIDAMVQELGIKNVRTKWGRIEEYQGSFDVVTARAVAYSDTLFAWMEHFLQQKTIVVLYKQFDAEEYEVICTWCRLAGFRVVCEHRYQLFEGDIERIIYVITGSTNTIEGSLLSSSQGS